jgi:F-type H+-transporting ATPase subunit delta
VPERDAIRRYAQAILEIAEAEGALEQVEDEVYRFARTVEQEGSLREALVDPTLPAERKRAMVEDLLGARASRHTVALIDFLVAGGRAKDLSGIATTLAELAAEQRGADFAEVRSAVPLDEDRRRRLAEALSAAIGRQVELKVLVDPDVIGGVVARVGDQVFDGSIRRRLELARRQLAGMR